jgi:phytoene/squalene synthetase
VTDPVADEYATALGQAMQLTNFLRDIKEDKEKLGRSYIYDDIQTLCNKARTLYRKAEL